MALPYLSCGLVPVWKGEVDFTHWLVNSGWLRRSFETVREQIGLKRH
jgi:hypothetical protein